MPITDVRKMLIDGSLEINNTVIQLEVSRKRPGMGNSIECPMASWRSSEKFCSASKQTFSTESATSGLMRRTKIAEDFPTRLNQP